MTYLANPDSGMLHRPPCSYVEFPESYVEVPEVVGDLIVARIRAEVAASDPDRRSFGGAMLWLCVRCLPDIERPVEREGGEWVMYPPGTPHPPLDFTVAS